MDTQKYCLQIMEMIVKNLQRCKTYAFLKLIKDAVLVKLIIPFGEKADLQIKILNHLIKEKENELKQLPTQSFHPSFGRTGGLQTQK